METNKDGWRKVAQSKKKQNRSDKMSSSEESAEAHDKTTDNKEPTLRSATTDSSRVPKNPNDERPTGGNIR